jgi:signal transduction histidine kinase
VNRSESVGPTLDVSTGVAGEGSQGFRLLRYFTLTSLVAILVLSVALYFLERMEEGFFHQVQSEQVAFFSSTQMDQARRQDAEARANLLAVYEVSHVNLTRVFANVLWDSSFAPFVASAQALSANHCQSPGSADPAATAAAAAAAATTECLAKVGRGIMALPGFAALDTKALETMQKTTAFKIKVFDRRGMTIYSSEHGQIGEDKSANFGWQTAAGGRPASELTHRDRFSAFEGTVENRDLISSYIPVRSTEGDQIVGVFEIYSDVTPLLDQIKEASARTHERAAANLRTVEEVAGENQRKVGANVDWILGIIGGLLLLLYAALWILARNAQRIIDRQAQAQELAIRREAIWHRDKMAALATMADNVSHEVGNPLATISGLAQEIELEQRKQNCTVCKPGLILEQTNRIADMVRNIADFAGARGQDPELVDVNRMVTAVCEFVAFDRRLHGKQIRFRPAPSIPACRIIPDHLNEVMMNVLLSVLETDVADRSANAIQVSTATRDNRVLISVDFGSGISGGWWPTNLAADARLDSVGRRVAGMGGQFARAGTTVEILLPGGGDELGA